MKLIIAIAGITVLLCSLSMKDKTEYLSDEAIIINGNIKNSKLKTFNGCGIGNFLIPSSGNIQQNKPPLLGALSYDFSSNLDYNIIDTIPGTKILGIAFKRKAWNDNTSLIEHSGYQSPYVVISDVGLFSYPIPYYFSVYSYTQGLAKSDSVLLPNIVKVASEVTVSENDPIVLLTEDKHHYKIRFYSYPQLTEQFNFSFHFEPEIFEVIEDDLFVIGSDSNNIQQLYHYSKVQDTLFHTYPLNDLVRNAQEVVRSNDSLFILSSPGDSITILSLVNLNNGAITQSTIYAESGARATHNEYKGSNLFTFQPISDTLNETLNKQILILNPISLSLDTFSVNLALDYFKHPKEASKGFGFFYLKWIGAKWNGNNLDSVYLHHTYRFQTGAFPQYINATYGCWVNTRETEREQIKFEFYPNPTSSNVTINLTGLIKGTKYDLSVIDNTGRVLQSNTIAPYQLIDLSLENYPKGIYYLKLNTGKNIITKKLVLQ